MADDKDITRSIVETVLAKMPSVPDVDDSGGGKYLLAYKAEVDVAVNNTTHIIHDMTPAAAHAQIETARQTHAVPAEESTKREVERTKQEVEVTKRFGQLSKQHYAVVGATLVCAVLAYLNREAGPTLAAMVTVLGGIYLGGRYFDKRQLPPKSDEGKPPESVGKKTEGAGKK